MKQDMILIIDLGGEHNAMLAREIRAMGVYTEIHPYDLTSAALARIPGIKGVILGGGPNNIVDGVAVSPSEAITSLAVPTLSFDYCGSAPIPTDAEQRRSVLSDFVFGKCHAEKNWNVQNFIDDQIELIRQQVGDGKVLLALSGGVDSSVVAALLIRAIGKNLTCVHVNHGLLRKGEPEQVVRVFRDQLGANLV